MTDREAFEKWAESNGFDADNTDEGIYRVNSTDAMYGGQWEGYGPVTTHRNGSECAEEIRTLVKEMLP